nr:MAG TPA: hypothetical protein [Caudoviricetes sp.]
MVGKIVAENLLTTYTELYYRVIFCGKILHKLTDNQRAHHGKMIRKR